MRRAMYRSRVNGWVCVGLAVSLAFGVLAGTASVSEAGKTPCPVIIPNSWGKQESTAYSGEGPVPLNPCPGFEWAKTFGIAGFFDQALGLDVTSDGGAVVLVRTQFGGPTVLRLDGEGTVLWQQNYGNLGGSNGDIRQTSDGGLVVAIGTSSPESILVYRIDAFGNILWQAAFDAAGSVIGPTLYSIAETLDGGFIVGGVALSADGLSRDLWALRLDSAGGVVWQRTFGGPGDDLALAGVLPTPDGGYVAAGRTAGDAGTSWVIMMDASGNTVWQKTYTAGYFVLQSIQTTTDGGFVAAGLLRARSSNYNWAVVKLAATGSITWQKTYGEAFGVASISQTSDGGYVSSIALVTGGSYDFALLRLTSTGNKVWQRTYGGLGDEAPCSSHCVREAADGNFLVAGYTESFGTQGGGSDDWYNTDAWVLRVFSDGTISSTCDPSFGTSSSSSTTQGMKLKVGNLAFTSSTPSMTILDPGVTATPGTLLSNTQCSA